MSPGLRFSLPSCVEELILSVGGSSTGHIARTPVILSLPQGLPPTVTHLTIVLRDFDSWVNPLRECFPELDLAFMKLSLRLAMRNHSLTIVGDLSIVNYKARSLQGKATYHVRNLHRMLHIIVQGEQGISHYPVPHRKPVEANLLLQKLPPLSPYDDTLVSCISADEWRSRVGEQVFGLSTNATFSVMGPYDSV